MFRSRKGKLQRKTAVTAKRRVMLILEKKYLVDLHCKGESLLSRTVWTEIRALSKYEYIDVELGQE